MDATELMFPVPSGQPATDVAEILAWHRRVLDAGRRDALAKGVTARARQFFLDRKLPAVSGGGPEGVRALMVWRARFIDWLSDVWDVIGEPELELPECQGLLALLDTGGDGRCRWCLTTVGEQHDCPILAEARSHWPTSPFGGQG